MPPLLVVSEQVGALLGSRANIQGLWYVRYISSPQLVDAARTEAARLSRYIALYPLPL
jgi:hypothetical protein